MSRVETEEASELAYVDDSAGFEDFIFAQESRGVRIIGAQRDCLRNVVFGGESECDEIRPTTINLSTVEW